MDEIVYQYSYHGLRMSYFDSLPRHIRDYINENGSKLLVLLRGTKDTIKLEEIFNDYIRAEERRIHFQ